MVQQTGRIAAIDQGTTSTRCLVMDPDGGTRIVAQIGHKTSVTEPGRSEQDPETLLANIRACLDAAGPVDAIGIANQGESCLAWDAVSGEALSPVLVWQDARTAEALVALARTGVADEVRRRSGLPLDPYFSAGKLAWILSNCPAADAALRAGRLRLGTTDAFFLDRLTGHFATDVSTASRTGLMNLETCQWDQTLCDIFGVPLRALPQIRRTTGDFGAVGGAPVTASIVDQQAALFGHGCHAPGQAKITFGTGAFLLAVADTRPDPATLQGLVPTVAWQTGDRPCYAVEGGVYDAASAIDWAIGAGYAGSLADFDGFTAAPAIARGITFVPAFSGLAAPWWSRRAKPLFAGFDFASGVVDFRQALLEGIALLTVDLIDLCAQRTGGDIALSVDGGLSRSAYFCQFLADCAQRPIRVSAFSDLTALGAARLAGQGAGLACAPDTPTARHIEPRHVPAALWRGSFRSSIERTL